VRRRLRGLFHSQFGMKLLDANVQRWGRGRYRSLERTATERGPSLDDVTPTRVCSMYCWSCGRCGALTLSRSRLCGVVFCAVGRALGWWMSIIRDGIGWKAVRIRFCLMVQGRRSTPGEPLVASLETDEFNNMKIGGYYSSTAGPA
jgi:hypothetical protein